MLPYLVQPQLSIGPLHIYAFGVLVAIAVLVGSYVARRRARILGLDQSVTQDLLTWVTVGGFLGGHVIDQIVYEPATLLSDPTRILRIWDGIGSIGGFIGAVLAALVFARRRRLGGGIWKHLDAVAYGFPFGWTFGRLGCAVAFDHPGVATQFLLGERYVDGIVRHNLGFEEALYTIALAAVFYVLGRKPRADGTFVGVLAVLYAPVRFALDFLRIGDARYFGMTPAQYGSALLALVGLAILVRHRAPMLTEASA